MTVEDLNQLLESQMVVNRKRVDESNSKLQTIGSKTVIYCIKLPDRILLSTDGRATDCITGRIHDEEYSKISCILDIGIYMVNCGNEDTMDAIFNILVDKYAANHVIDDISEIADFIVQEDSRGGIIVEGERADKFDMVLGGMGSNEELRLIHIEKKLNRPCLSRNKNLVTLGSGSGKLKAFKKLPKKIKDILIKSSCDEIDETTGMHYLLDSIEEATLTDWASGGRLMCMSIRKNQMIRRIHRRMVTNGLALKFYNPDAKIYEETYDVCKEAKYDCDDDGDKKCNA